VGREIRADALAVECGVPVARVLELLVELGQVQNRRVSQHVPERLARLVRQQLAGPVPRPAAERAPDRAVFEQAMSAAGVVPLGREPARPARPAVPRAAAPALRVAPVQAPVPPGESAVGAPGGAAGEEDPRLVAALARCATLEARVEDLEARRQDARRAGLLELEAARSALLGAEELAARLSAARAGGPGEQRVVDLLVRRGLLGVDEGWSALRTLAAAHLLDGALPFLTSVDGARLERVLADRLCLCCGREDCGRPEGVELIVVPPQRCELCGGEDVVALCRRFSDACLLAGINRVLFVGGRRWAAPWFGARLHRRVELRCWPQDLSPRSEIVEIDLAWAQFVVLRDDGRLGEELAACARAGLPRACVSAPGTSTGQVVAVATALVEQIDPASLLGI